MEVLGFVDENGDPSFEVANEFLNHGVLSTMSWYKFLFHGWRDWNGILTDRAAPVYSTPSIKKRDR